MQCGQYEKNSAMIGTTIKRIKTKKMATVSKTKELISVDIVAIPDEIKIAKTIAKTLTMINSSVFLFKRFFLIRFSPFAIE